MDFFGDLFRQIGEDMLRSGKRQLDELRLGKKEADRQRRIKYEKRRRLNEKISLVSGFAIAVLLSPLLFFPSYPLLGIPVFFGVWALFYGMLNLFSENPYK